MYDQFEPLTAEEKSTNSNRQSKPKKDEGVAILPVPEDAPQDSPLLNGQTPSFCWDYRDAERNLLFRLYRIDGQGKEKNFLPRTFRQYQDGSRRWAWKSVPEPRPLYRLDKLAVRPNAPALVCEGEKAADAAQNIFPEYVATTSLNGCKSPEKADWSALKGRDVMIWPDHDDAGRKYAQSVAELVLSAGAISAAIVQIPKLFPEKWDLADPLPEGYGEAELQEMLFNALSFTLEDNGTDYESLKARAQKLSEDSHPDICTSLINDLAKLPAIHKRTIMQIIKSRSKIPFAQQTEAMQENGDPVFQPDHLQIARQVINTIGQDNIIGSQSHIWLWSETGVWRALTERELRQKIQRGIESLGLEVFKGTVEGVADVLKSEVFGLLHDWNRKKDCINVLNGTLSWTGEDWKISSHSRDDYFTAIIPQVFDPEADCHRFKLFLAEIFEGDPDHHQKACALLEMMG